MPHPIVEIDELVRPIIDYLVRISPQAVASLALTCRSLEEPALSSLWKRQYSLIVLVKVLPQHTWVEERVHLPIERDPPPEDWDRLQRYASWMRELELGKKENITDNTLSRLSHNSPDGVLCPNLERLDWDADAPRTLLPFFRLFLSPRLKTVNFHVHPNHLGVKLFLPQVILRLPSSLERLSLMCDQEGEPLTNALSSFVCRCGSSLKRFSSDIRLSEMAIHHLIQLPNLHYWFTTHEPPWTVPPSIFPSLERLHLSKPAASSWLYLLAAHGEYEHRSGFAPATAMLKTNSKDTLKYLVCPENTPVGPTFLSSVSQFRNLATLYVKNEYCRYDCTFGLTDDDVENLAISLPSLVDLRLGGVCGLNSCRTTVSSLLSITIYCPRLVLLEIHFNTQTIAGDIQRLVDAGSVRGGPRSRLRDLFLGYLPPPAQEDIETVAMGFRAIFPCLIRCHGGREWGMI